MKNNRSLFGILLLVITVIGLQVMKKQNKQQVIDDQKKVQTETANKVVTQAKEKKQQNQLEIQQQKKDSLNKLQVKELQDGKQKLQETKEKLENELKNKK